MGSWLTWMSRPRLLASLWTQARLAWRLGREPQVPVLTKLLLIVPVVYLVSPLDVVPDVLPGLGQLDDLAVVALALRGFVSLCPADLVAFHRRALETRKPFRPVPPSEVVIDAEFHRHDSAS